ncbi:MAG: phospho-sugar mutase, partial [Thermoguttaceae bacterium]
MIDTQAAVDLVARAAAEGKLSPGAAANIRTWLTEPYLAEYAPQVAAHLAARRWKQLDDVFWTTIPFGTGGRRGTLYPIGTNAINDRTIGESAQGLADYVKEATSEKGENGSRGDHAGRGARSAREGLSCAIAYDTRHRSREFAELSAGIMAAAGFQVYFLNGYRSTPEISFTVRYKHCDCGIMITASHNPPSDNAVKIYWSSGGQLLPPHDQRCIEHVYQVRGIQRMPWSEGIASGKIVYCEEEVDPAFIRAVVAQSTPGPRQLRIIYSPLHGVGQSAVSPVLAAAGFQDVEVFGPHAAPDPDFTNVPQHIANPENPAVFDAIIQRGRQIEADLILATDPDCDRLGVAAPLEARPGAAWATLTGNQVGALLTDS